MTRDLERLAMRFASCALLCVTALAACSGNSTQTVAPRTDLFGSWRVDPTVADSLRHDGSEERTGAQVKAKANATNVRSLLVGGNASLGTGCIAPRHRLDESLAFGADRADADASARAPHLETPTRCVP